MDSRQRRRFVDVNAGTRNSNIDPSSERRDRHDFPVYRPPGRLLEMVGLEGNAGRSRVGFLAQQLVTGRR